MVPAPASFVAAGVGLLAALAALSGTPAQQAGRQPLRGTAYRIVELSSGRVVASSLDDVLRARVLPGSILKIATLVAGLESGTIQPTTRIACPRRLEIDGRRLDCSHPDLGRPLSATEALAHSCNGYFAAVARRLSREALDKALVQLGLPPSSPSASVINSALGLDGMRVSPDLLLEAFVRLTASGNARVPANVRQVVLDGLRGAAVFGTASAFRERGLTALAKTGTAPMPGGGFEGLVVAVTPADRPARGIVLLAPGAAGMDAARLAAELLQPIPAGTNAGSPLQRAPDAAAAIRAIRVGTANGRGYEIRTLPLEEYVSRVVGGESAPSSGNQAQQALAIVARTFALRNLGRHAREGFDLCDLTHCQVMGTATPSSRAAAKATAGGVLVHEGRLADVYYTASCGGHSERPSRAWPGAEDRPYLPARPEPECAEERWQSDVSASDLGRALVTAGRHGSLLLDLRVTARTESGRASAVRIDGFEPAVIAGETLRLAVGRTLGWQVLKSTLFDVARTASGYRFVGTGRGHGVGLCEAGSSRMAAAGQSMQSILRRYFPGTDVRSASSLAAASARVVAPPVRVKIVVPAAEERERARIEDVAAAALRDYSSRLGAPAPEGIRIVAHPTVEAYTRASGQPWWTAGATRDLRIDLIPLAALRRRGVLESTLRHELAHAVTSRRLQGRPIWVQEAVAMDLTGDPRFSEGPAGDALAPATGRCPSDAEWRALRSADELQRAYRRAAACYAAQRAKGVPWDEVR